MADAASRSLCMPMRFLSRQVIWITGSTPSAWAINPAPMLDILTMAVWQSVILTASTLPRRIRAFFLTTSGSLFLGGPSSPVTANSPLASTRSRLLPAFIDPPYLLISNKKRSFQTGFQPWNPSPAIKCRTCKRLVLFPVVISVRPGHNPFRVRPCLQAHDASAYP